MIWFVISIGVMLYYTVPWVLSDPKSMPVAIVFSVYPLAFAIVVAVAACFLVGALIKDKWVVDTPIQLEAGTTCPHSKRVFVGRKWTYDGVVYSYATCVAGGSLLPVRMKPISSSAGLTNVRIYEEPRKDGELIVYRSKPAISWWWLIGIHLGSESYAFHIPEGTYCSECSI